MLLRITNFRSRIEYPESELPQRTVRAIGGRVEHVRALKILRESLVLVGPEMRGGSPVALTEIASRSKSLASLGSILSVGGWLMRANSNS